jgi:undecaprenyl pyrophosphate phosphatase UppP
MTTTQNLSGLTRKTYRRLVYGTVGIGILGLLVGIAIDQNLAGTVIYMLGAWIGGGIAFLAPRVSDTRLQDERDYELHNRASGFAMGITMIVGLGLIPPVYVLDAGGYITITETVSGGILVASALFLLYGLCFGIVKRRN